jgi:3-phenylpropionate/trans-cinnamate dioxygenase ferredoxin subunit
MAFQKLIPISEIKEGDMVTVSTRYCDLAITCVNGEYFAFEDVCPHDGGSISDGSILDGKVICPRHSAEFDIRSGKVLCMPATEDLPVYPIRISGDHLEVDLDDLK